MARPEPPQAVLNSLQLAQEPRAVLNSLQLLQEPQAVLNSLQHLQEQRAVLNSRLSLDAQVNDYGSRAARHETQQAVLNNQQRRSVPSRPWIGG